MNRIIKRIIIFTSLVMCLSLCLSVIASATSQLSKAYSNDIGEDVIIINEAGFNAQAKLTVKPSVVEIKTTGSGTVDNAGSYKISLVADGKEIDIPKDTTLKLRIPQLAKDKNLKILQIRNDGQYSALKHTETDGYAVVEVDYLGEFVFLCQEKTTSPIIWIIFGVLIAAIVGLGAWLFLKDAKKKKAQESEPKSHRNHHSHKVEQ